MDALRYITLVYIFSRKNARHAHTSRQQYEEETRGHVQPNLAGIHGHKVCSGTVGNGEQDERHAGGYAT